MKGATGRTGDIRRLRVVDGPAKITEYPLGGLTAKAIGPFCCARRDRLLDRRMTVVTARGHRVAFIRPLDVKFLVITCEPLVSACLLLVTVPPIATSDQGFIYEVSTAPSCDCYRQTHRP
jgi:hypothetical protein